jgi:hypothetical protein
MEAEAEAAADPLAASPMVPARRKISHRKNPSDTFAFAAGHLFLQSTPEDFYSLGLEPPLEPGSHAAAAGQSFGAARGSSRQPGSSLMDLAAAGSTRQHQSGPGAVSQQQQQVDQTNAAFGGLHVQVGNCAHPASCSLLLLLQSALHQQ